MKKTEIITLDLNPLSYHSKDIDCKVKYYKRNVTKASESIILKSVEDISLGEFKKYAWASLEKRCHCEHDCCGHWFTSSMGIKRISKNTFRLNIQYAQNY